MNQLVRQIFEAAYLTRRIQRLVIKYIEGYIENLMIITSTIMFNAKIKKKHSVGLIILHRSSNDLLIMCS